MKDLSDTWQVVSRKYNILERREEYSNVQNSLEIKIIITEPFKIDLSNFLLDQSKFENRSQKVDIMSKNDARSIPKMRNDL